MIQSKLSKMHTLTIITKRMLIYAYYKNIIEYIIELQYNIVQYLYYKILQYRIIIGMLYNYLANKIAQDVNCKFA